MGLPAPPEVGANALPLGTFDGRIVIVTGGALTPETEAFLNSVPVLVTHKPFRARHLREVLADFLGDP